MKTTAVTILVAALTLVVACATPTRADVARDRTAQLRDAVASSVADAARAAELQAAVKAMEAVLIATIEENEKLNREFVVASSDPNADPNHLRALAARVATERRAAMHRFLQARLDLRRRMSPQEWTHFAKALPAFDGGQS